MILSAGFAEVGEEGLERQRELMAVCRGAGMRVVGPNCLGVLNTDPAVSMNATFAPGTPLAGHVAFVSQSGAFGIAAIDLAGERSIGLSSFVSAGDKADLSGNDFLQYFEDDPRTHAILLYLESFGNPRRFGRIARQVSASKPVIAVKSGRSPAGRRAVSSHTGAMVAASDTTVDALFAHAGVTRTETIGEMLDVAGLLTRQPLPPGDRIAVVTNAGGPGILCADALAAQGLQVAPLAEGTQRALRDALPVEASVGNPVDMIASASAEDYARVLELVLADPGVDAVVSIFVRPLATRARDVAAAVAATAELPVAAAKPLLAVFLGADHPPAAAFRPARRAAVRHARGGGARARPRRAPRAPGRGAARSAARARGARPRPGRGDRRLARSAPAAAGSSPRTSADCCARSGSRWPAPAWWRRPRRPRRRPPSWAARSPSRGSRRPCVHKTEAGAVRLGLEADGVERAAREMAEAVGAAGHEIEGFLVQTMAPEGVELLVGVVGDPAFGPLVAVGAGGTAAELIRDIQVRLAPLGRREAAEMLRALRTFPLLDGYRGRPRADIAAVEDVVVRMSALAAAHPEIAELDCNPMMAGPAGTLVVDARVRLAPPPERRPVGALDR